MNKAEQLVKLLIEKKYTVSFAESCTGGKMAARIVDVPDASKVLNASIVTYANEAKMKYANVSKDTLKQYGALVKTLQERWLKAWQKLITQMLQQEFRA